MARADGRAAMMVALKRDVLGLLRAGRLLPAADWVSLLRWRVMAFARNRAFKEAHPHVAVPPADLAFDAYNHVDWHIYIESGRRHAEVFAQALAGAGLPEQAAILEWGCGPGRIIRHMQTALPGRAVSLTGTDYNGRSVAWCQAHLPGITFAENGLMPPLSFADGTFDAAYAFSVLTHLSEQVQLAWTRELLRVLKPGGVLACSTHGDANAGRLADREEAARYAAGEPVVQSGYAEGKKWFLALHPPRYVRERLLDGYEDARQLDLGPDAGMLQDVWVARKPGPAQSA